MYNVSIDIDKQKNYFLLHFFFRFIHKLLQFACMNSVKKALIEMNKKDADDDEDKKFTRKTLKTFRFVRIHALFAGIANIFLLCLLNHLSSVYNFDESFLVFHLLLFSMSKLNNISAESHLNIKYFFIT